jgi:hypothetical protein
LNSYTIKEESEEHEKEPHKQHICMIHSPRLQRNIKQHKQANGLILLKYRRNDWDPWTRYSFQKANNNTVTPWHFELCTGKSQTPHYPTESTSNCTEARAYYSAKWGLNSSVCEKIEHERSRS